VRYGDRRTVDPMLAVEDSGDDARTEGASGVQRTTGVVDTDELCDEKGQADTDGGDEGC
jgi:hypothetical protein